MKTEQKQFVESFPGQPHYYGNAAHAFYDIMRWVQKNRKKPKPNIVMPAYIPAKLYRFILAAGYVPKFYDVSANLDYSVDEINELIDENTQMLFAVHFFGIPVDLKPFKDLTQERNIFLFEDCAHTLNGFFKGTMLGSTGDFTIFSIRKMLQLHCGGILFLNEEPWAFSPSSQKRVRNSFTGYHITGSRLKFFLNRASGGKNLLQKIEIPGTGYIDFAEEQKVQVKKMDLLSQWYFGQVNLNKVISIRRENVEFLMNEVNRPDLFKQIGYERVTEISGSNGKEKRTLADGYVPFSMPILVEPGWRDRMQQKMLEAGIVCYIGWPEAPFGMDGFPQSKKLQAHLLELPVHHYINKHQLSKMADVLNTL